MPTYLPTSLVYGGYQPGMVPVPGADPRSVAATPYRAPWEDPEYFRRAYRAEAYGAPLDPEDEAILRTVRSLTPQKGPEAYEGLTPAGAPDESALARLQETQRLARRETLTGMGIAALGGAAQLGAQAIPTSYDIYSKERLAEVRRQLGQLPEPVERQFKTAQAGLAAQATERRQRAEAVAAGQGAVSVRQAAAPGREAAREQITGQVQLGAEKARAEAANLDAQLTEIEQREAQKGQRQAALLATGAGIVGQAAGLLGEARAGKLMQQVDLSPLAGIEDPLERALVLQTVMAAKTPAERAALVQLYGGATGGPVA